MIVLEYRRDGADLAANGETEDRINLEQESTKVNDGAHSHAESDVFTFYRGQANVLDLSTFPQNRNISQCDDVATARFDGFWRVIFVLDIVTGEVSVNVAI